MSLEFVRKFKVPVQMKVNTWEVVEVVDLTN